MGLFDLFKSTENRGVEEIEDESQEVQAGNTLEENLHHEAKDLLTEILDLMGFFNVVKVINNDRNSIELEIKGDDLGRIIGKEGNTLFALQVLMKTILSRKYKRPVSIQIDANNYKEKRMVTVKSMALEAAKKALAERKEVALAPMNAWERRVVHTTLMENDQVKTESIGRDKERQVIISPK